MALIVTNQLEWSVKNGESINLSSKYWSYPIRQNALMDSKVAELLEGENKNWNLRKLYLPFDQQATRDISQTQPSWSDMKDWFAWLRSTSGSYSVKKVTKFSLVPTTQVSKILISFLG